MAGWGEGMFLRAGTHKETCVTHLYLYHPLSPILTSVYPPFGRVPNGRGCVPLHFSLRAAAGRPRW